MRSTFTVLLVCATAAALGTQDCKAYQNYDFVPGYRIVFDEDFRADKDGDADDEKQVSVGDSVATDGFEKDLSAAYPGDKEAFNDKWHHVAIAFKSGR